MEANEYYYWCFVCKKECLVLEADDGELQCEKCLSSFVEELPSKKPINKNQNELTTDNIEDKIQDEEKENNLTNKTNNIRIESVRIPDQINQVNNPSSNIANSDLISEHSNLIDINFNNLSNRPIQTLNAIDDPRNFEPIMNTNSNQRRNNGISSISFSNQEGNALIQMQMSGLGPNENTNNFNSGISNMINSLFSAISGNSSSNIVNISNNNVSFNLTGLLGNHANSLIQGLQSINFNSILGRDINDNAFENILNIVMRSDNGSPPASEQVINSLERMEINEDNFENFNKENCAICADEYLLKQKIICLSCSHFFHEECIITWLRKRNQCPVCRKELKTDDEDYEKRRSENRLILNNLMRSNSNNFNNNDENGDLDMG